MSAFNPGTGFFVATYKAAALLEAAYALNSIEQEISTTDNPVNNITVTVDFEAASAAIAATLPITPTLGNAGSIVVSARDYLNNPANFGAGSDLKAGNYPAAFLEIAQILGAAEQALETPVNNVAITFDLEGGTSTITAAIPIILGKNDDGSIRIVAADYA